MRWLAGMAMALGVWALVAIWIFLSVTLVKLWQ